MTEIYCRFTINRLSYHTTGWHLLDCTNEFFQKLSAIRAHTPEKFTSPVLGQKHLKIVSVTGHQTVCLFKAPTYLGQTLGISSDKLHVANSNYAFGEKPHSLTSLLMYASTAGNVLIKELKLWKTAVLTFAKIAFIWFSKPVASFLSSMLSLLLLVYLVCVRLFTHYSVSAWLLPPLLALVYSAQMH